MFLLDTDTVIYNMKGNVNVQKNLRHHIDSVNFSVITLMELYYGARKSQKVSANLAKIKTLVTNNTKHFQRIDGLKLANWA